MRVKCLAIVVGLAVCLVGGRTMRRLDAARVPGAGAPASAAVALLRSDRVVRLEVFYFPRDMETLTAITPESLEKQAWYRIDVQQFQWSAIRTSLINALEAATFTPVKDRPDCRWGCIFYDARNARVLTIYLDGPAWLGLVDGASVTGVGPLANALETRCSQLWSGEVKYHPLARQ